MRKSIKTDLLMRRGFSPGRLSAVKYWLDAGTITGVADGATIAATDWRDGSFFHRGGLGTATALTFRANAGNGLPAIEFNGSTSTAVSPAFSVAIPHRIFLVTKPIAWSSNKFVLDGQAVNQSSISYDTIGGINNGLGIDDFAGSQIAPWLGVENGIVALYDVVFNGASSSLQVSGQVLKTGTSVKATTLTGITLGQPGNLTGGFAANMQVLDLVVCDSTLIASLAAQMRKYLIKKHAIITRKYMICDGNSLTLGVNSTTGNDYPNQLARLLAGGAATWQILNNGQSGQTTPQMDTQASGGGGSPTDAFLGYYTRTVVIGWEVTNDIVTNNPGATTAYNNIVTFFNNRRAANPAAKLVVMTCIARVNITGSQETDRLAVNANIVANWASFADGVADVASDSRLGTPGNTTYFAADGIHLTDAGYAVVASYLQPVVDSFA